MARPAQCQPFLKWPGGKRWLAPLLADVIGEVAGTYFEPFVGGGAVFFHLRPARAILSDVNPELVSVYRQVRDRVGKVISGLESMSISKRAYYRCRSNRPRTAVGRAVRFLYLNRTAFNGMYRVNRDGEFNVPFGCKPTTVLCDTALLRSASRALAGVKCVVADFEQQIDRAGDGDVVYCDPPYTVMHDNNGFVRYNESLFSWEDQVRLAQACKRAARRKARVVVSDAHHELVAALYPEFDRRIVNRQSRISGSKRGRGEVSEYVFMSAGMGGWAPITDLID